MTKKTIIIIAAVIVGLLIIGAVSPKDNTTNKQTETKQVQTTNKASEIAKRIGLTEVKDTFNYVGWGGKNGVEGKYGANNVEVYEFEQGKIADGMKKLNDFGGTELRRSGNVIIVVHNYPNTNANEIANTLAGKL